MDMKDIGKVLLKASRSKKKTAFLDAYQKHFLEIEDAVSKYSGRKTTLRLGDGDDIKAAISVSALVNDLTLINLPSGGEMEISAHVNQKEILGLGGSIKIETNRPENLASSEDGINVLPAFARRSDELATSISEAIAPLAMRGRAIIVPERILLSHKSKDPSGRNHWQVHDVDSDSPVDVWRATFSDQKPPETTLVGEGGNSQEIKLADIIVPYLQGVNFYDYSRILEDNDLHISKLRRGLTEVTAEANSKGQNIDQVINDVVRPELDALHRKFDALSASRSLRQQGAVVGTALMVFAAVATGGLVQIAAALGGATGLGLVYKQEADFLEKKREIEENPFYLLWRLKNVSRK